MTNDNSRHVVPEAALDARYRQRRLVLLVALIAFTALPVVAMGAWWMWPLLCIPAVLAAPLAGATGLIGSLLAAAIAMAAASGGAMASAEVLIGFATIIALAALGAAHAGLADGVIARVGGAGRDAAGALAPADVFDLIADRDCRRAAEGGASVSVAVVAIPRIDSIDHRHGPQVSGALLYSAASAVMGAVGGSDLVIEQSEGCYVALVAGPAGTARGVAGRIAAALEGVAVRDTDGLRVTAGPVAVGVAEWVEGDTGPDSLIDRASAAMRQDMPGSEGSASDGLTSEFSPVAVADAA